jgi:alpha-galactosidase
VPVPVKLAEAGSADRANIRDLWANRDLGTFDTEFAPDVQFHGARLFRLSPVH